MNSIATVLLILLLVIVAVAVARMMGGAAGPLGPTTRLTPPRDRVVEREIVQPSAEDRVVEREVERPRTQDRVVEREVIERDVPPERL